ncbi:AMPKBI-domain-containing protein [Microthyrium microscopicum]|uniref:AMPKBI-domain-containing protein n=1 Tax=Microthyrium microscopicum TaxID=703497 RepID=A0A6A6UDR5_9PEZI|nr:AMPKBI-domain-containing protein [Microthyrium microscopicum]
MGNSPSTQAKAGGQPSPRPSTGSANPPPSAHHIHHTHSASQPTTSTSLSSVVSSSAAQPSESFEIAEGQSVSNYRERSASAILRSQTAGHGHNPTSAPTLRHIDSGTNSSRLSSTSTLAMGNAESKSKKGHDANRFSPPAAKPIAAPAVSNIHSKPSDPILDNDSYFATASDLSRPPRLPLPIQDEVRSPGSPIISPTDVADDPIDASTQEAALLSTTSVLSNTTLDEEDVGDNVDTVRGGVLPSVPTVVEWREGGNKVYVTGTFADWDRKYRLSREGPAGPGVLSTTIHLQPGTYHLRFIVEGEMLLSKHLPTAVDFTNSLVNYIEVVSQDTTPTAALENLQLQNDASQPINIGVPVEEADPVHPPQTLPPTPELGPTTGPSSVPPEPGSSADQQGILSGLQFPSTRYSKKIPQFFIDTDADESSEEYSRVIELSNVLPTPPSLPSFLSKSILNMATPMKDDASVLVNPNHTVLNHLATSSIKGGVIATSMTTRYGRKFETTIMYKPTHPGA